MFGFWVFFCPDAIGTGIFIFVRRTGVHSVGGLAFLAAGNVNVVILYRRITTCITKIIYGCGGNCPAMLLYCAALAIKRSMDDATQKAKTKKHNHKRFALRFRPRNFPADHRTPAAHGGRKKQDASRDRKATRNLQSRYGRGG